GGFGGGAGAAGGSGAGGGGLGGIGGGGGGGPGGGGGIFVQKGGSLRITGRRPPGRAALRGPPPPGPQRRRHRGRLWQRDFRSGQQHADVCAGERNDADDPGRYRRPERLARRL